MVRVLVQSGSRGFGVNSVAREAGVDKVLVYRYFGGLPQLLRAFSEGRRLWPTIEEQVGLNALGMADLDPEDLAGRLFAGLIREVRRDPLLQEVLRWEWVEQNELTTEMARAREKWGQAARDLIPPPSPDSDPPAVLALLTAGVLFLTVRGALSRDFLDLDLGSSRDWDRIEQACRLLARHLAAEHHT